VIEHVTNLVSGSLPWPMCRSVVREMVLLQRGGGTRKGRKVCESGCQVVDISWNLQQPQIND
jgi:hypothetical protein